MKGSPRVAAFLYRHVVPEGKTVGEAAKRLRMSRPALSNVLNGRAELSIPLALKLETEYGLTAMIVLEWQLADKLEAARARKKLS